MKCIQWTHNGKTVSGVECLSFIYQTTPDIYTSYVTDKCLNISDKAMSLIVQFFLILVTKTFTGVASIYFLKKKEEISNGACWLQRLRDKDYPVRMDQTGYKKNFYLPMTGKCSFLTQQKSCDPLATSLVRYWIYSNFPHVFRSSLIFMWMCLRFVKLAMRRLSVTRCVVIGGCTVPLSTSQPGVWINVIRAVSYGPTLKK